MHSFSDPRAIANATSTAAALSIEATPVETWSAQLTHLIDDLTSHVDPDETRALTQCLQQLRAHTEHMLLDLSATGLDDADTHEQTLLTLRQAARAITKLDISQWGAFVGFLLEKLDEQHDISTETSFEIELTTLITTLASRLRTKHW